MNQYQKNTHDKGGFIVTNGFGNKKSQYRKKDIKKWSTYLKILIF